jgi:hypothetical protein
MTQEIVVTQPQQDLISVIAQVAQNPDVTLEKMQALLDMKKQVDAMEAEKAFAEDFARMKPHLPRIIKTHDNKQTHSKYAKLEDISAVVDPIIGEYGFSTRFKTEQSEKLVTATCILLHRSGHKEETCITLPLDDAGIAGTKNKTAVHAIASSIMYAKRLAKCAVLDISTGDDDGNAAGGENAVIAFQAETLKGVLMACSPETKEWFAEKYGSVNQVPAQHFTVVLTQLQVARDKFEKKAKAENADS